MYDTLSYFLEPLTICFPRQSSNFNIMTLVTYSKFKLTDSSCQI